MSPQVRTVREKAPSLAIDVWPPVGYWLKVAGGIIVLFALSRMISAAQNVLILLLVSLILAIGLQPAVARLERMGLKRGPAVAALAIIGILVVGGFLALVVPTIITQLGQLVEKAPDYIQRAQDDSGFIADINERFDLTEKLRSLGETLPSTALSLFRSFTSLVFNTLTIFILTLYFTSGLPRMRHAIAGLLRRADREHFEAILEESTERVGGYMLGNMAISAIAGVVSFIALTIIGVPYAVALAFWVALADLIPNIGALLGAAVAVLVAAFAGVPTLIATAVFFLIYQQLENYVIAPRVMKRAIEMSAAAVLVAVLIGVSLAGFVGALLALPAAAIVKITVQRLYVGERREAVLAADAELAAASESGAGSEPPARKTPRRSRKS